MCEVQEKSENLTTISNLNVFLVTDMLETLSNDVSGIHDSNEKALLDS